MFVSLNKLTSTSAFAVVSGVSTGLQQGHLTACRGVALTLDVSCSPAKAYIRTKVNNFGQMCAVQGVN